MSMLPEPLKRRGSASPGLNSPSVSRASTPSLSKPNIPALITNAEHKRGEFKLNFKAPDSSTPITTVHDQKAIALGEILASTNRRLVKCTDSDERGRLESRRGAIDAVLQHIGKADGNDHNIPRVDIIGLYGSHPGCDTFTGKPEAGKGTSALEVVVVKVYTEDGEKIVFLDMTGTDGKATLSSQLKKGGLPRDGYDGHIAHLGVNAWERHGSGALDFLSSPKAKEYFPSDSTYETIPSTHSSRSSTLSDYGFPSSLYDSRTTGGADYRDAHLHSDGSYPTLGSSDPHYDSADRLSPYGTTSRANPRQDSRLQKRSSELYNNNSLGSDTWSQNYATGPQPNGRHHRPATRTSELYANHQARQNRDEDPQYDSALPFQPPQPSGYQVPVPFNPLYRGQQKGPDHTYSAVLRTNLELSRLSDPVSDRRALLSEQAALSPPSSVSGYEDPDGGPTYDLAGAHPAGNSPPRQDRSLVVNGKEYALAGQAQPPQSAVGSTAGKRQVTVQDQPDLDSTLLQQAPPPASVLSPPKSTGPKNPADSVMRQLSTTLQPTDGNQKYQTLRPQKAAQFTSEPREDTTLLEQAIATNEITKGNYSEFLPYFSQAEKQVLADKDILSLGDRMKMAQKEL